ncbi:unnamed protein product, partial [Ixodes pacificus]
GAVRIDGLAFTRGHWRSFWKRHPYSRGPGEPRNGLGPGRLWQLGRPRSLPQNRPSLSQRGRASKGPGRRTASSRGEDGRTSGGPDRGSR